MRDEIAHGYRVIVVVNDNTENMIFEYLSEKLAYSVAASYKRMTFVESVEIEEF